MDSTFEITGGTAGVYVENTLKFFPEIKEAVRQYAEAGLFAAPFDEDVGGLQLPQLLHYASIAISWPPASPPPPIRC